MPPRKMPVNQNASGSNNHEIDLAITLTATQFQELMQAMLDQQRQANENQARFQEQMAKKDEEMAQVQRQLLEVLQNRPQPQPMQPLGPNIVINNRDHDTNILYERFRKRGPKQFSRQEDPITVDDWLANTQKIFYVFICTGRQKVHLTTSLFYGFVDTWWQTVKEPYLTMANDGAWEAFKTQFTDKYIPSHVKRQKAIEF